jgi:hypothetical protein
MDLVKAGQIAALMLAPTVVVAAGIALPRAFRMAAERVRRRRAALRPQGRPIEQISADLDRLLRMYGRLRRTPNEAGRGKRMRALEAAIGDCAGEAARALGVTLPRPTAPAGYHLPQLGAVLRALTDAGLAVPAAPELFANNHH